MTHITREMFIAAVGCEPQQDDLNRCNCTSAGKMGHEQCGWSTKHNKPNFLITYMEVMIERAEAQTEKAPPVWTPKYGHSIVLQRDGIHVMRDNKTVHKNDSWLKAVEWVKNVEAQMDAEPKSKDIKMYSAHKGTHHNIWSIADPGGVHIATISGLPDAIAELLNHLNR